MASVLQSHLLADEMLRVIPKTMRSIRVQVRRLTTSDLSLTQFRVLARLNESSKSNSELANEIGVSFPAMTRFIDCMVKKGWITRKSGSADRRKIELAITATGRAVFLKIRRQMAVHFSVQISALSSGDRRLLHQGLKVLNKMNTEARIR